MIHCGGAFKIDDSGGRARIVSVFIPPRAALENVDDPVAVRWKLLPQKENAHRFVFRARVFHVEKRHFNRRTLQQFINCVPCHAKRSSVFFLERFLIPL